MYEDSSWYNALTPSAPVPLEPPNVPQLRDHESSLSQPHGVDEANSNPTESNNTKLEVAAGTRGPPSPTIARRARSYADFYNAAIAQLSRDASAEQEIELNSGSQPLTDNLQTTLDFQQWYDGLEAELLDASEEEYLLYRDQLLLSESHLDSVLVSTSSTLNSLSSLATAFSQVKSQTAKFQGNSQGLLLEQRRISKLATDLGENLRFYDYLEPITKRLNAPGAGQIVRGAEFSEMLTNLDSCVKYMEAHDSHAESQTYRSRYRLLLTRALTLIRVHFVNSLREIAGDVSKRIADRQLNDTTMSALLYAKFRVGASDLKAMGQEIQKRAAIPFGDQSATQAEYQSLMNELYQNYSTIRGRLVLPLVRKKVGEIAMAPSTSKDLVAFARSSIGYIRGLCADEYDLWNDWFEGNDGLYDFLESLCEPFYDHLRPRIIHETQLVKLCELCTLLQNRYSRPQDEDTDQDEAPSFDFSVIIQPALSDTQTRIVFRAQSILRDEIEHYRPKPEDLELPRSKHAADSSDGVASEVATSGRRSSATADTRPRQQGALIFGAVEESSNHAENRSVGWDFDLEAGSRDWYPTLKKAIWLLSRIYRLVNSTVFDDLAHRIVHETTLSLHQAASQVSSKYAAIEGQLFLLKHLLILKAQIVAFDIEFVTPEIAFEFSSVSSTFWELRERGGLFNPRTLVRLMGGGLLPRVVENMLDAKAELDGRLRTVIKDFTNASAARMTIALSKGGIGKKWTDNAVIIKSLQETIQKEVPLLRGKLKEYLQEIRTRETLIAAVQEQVIQNYDDFCHRLAERGPKVSQTKTQGPPSEVWDTKSFASWTDSVFEAVQGDRQIGSDRSRSHSRSRQGSV